MVFIDNENRYEHLIFAVLAVYRMVKYLRAPKLLNGLDE